MSLTRKLLTCDCKDTDINYWTRGVCILAITYTLVLPRLKGRGRGSNCRDSSQEHGCGDAESFELNHSCLLGGRLISFSNFEVEATVVCCIRSIVGSWFLFNQARGSRGI